MRDFTLAAYKRYVQAISVSCPNFLRFDEYFLANPKPERFCLIRHDIDRKPHRALQMAQLEHEMGIKATYYFRTKSHTFKPEIITAIAGLGHEIGYHYESLSDANGDMSQALQDFDLNLRKLRELAPIRTISMHGRPLKPFDNRDIWRDPDNHALLWHEFGVLGEVYLDIDYSHIVYINDTGRNWSSTASNLRDLVESGLKLDFASGTDLYAYFKSNPHPKLVFQVHPERWTDNATSYYLSFCFDFTANVGKKIFRLATSNNNAKK